MHEMSIAWELLSQLESIAAENAVERIESVSVAAGVLRGVVPEAMQMAFAEASKGTCAEDARLLLEIVPAEARCRLCEARFTPKPDSYLCERCGQADVELVAGDDIVLTSITCQQSEGGKGDEDQRRDQCP